MPLFETFRKALGALCSSVGGPEGLKTLLLVHCRPGVDAAAQQLLDGSLEGALADRRAKAEAARTALLAGWHGGSGDGGSSDSDSGME